jgi:hypothetical protein
VLLPIEATMPIPVTTTRFMSASPAAALSRDDPVETGACGVNYSNESAHDLV